MERKPAERPEMAERGAPKDGQPQLMNRRLFMQFMALTGCTDPAPLIAALEKLSNPAVLYADAHDPQGVGLLTMSEDPAFFVDELRQVLQREPFADLTIKPEHTCLGRTYSLGYEPDLQETLFDRPRRTALNPAWCWAVWYPLRRSGEFAQLPQETQMEILREHGTIGFSFGSADLAHDIRLACHGLDTNDNDFVVGLLGKELHPLSALVQTMRKTKQTSLYLERLGPFFVGKVIWQARA